MFWFFFTSVPCKVVLLMPESPQMRLIAMTVNSERYMRKVASFRQSHDLLSASLASSPCSPPCTLTSCAVGVCSSLFIDADWFGRQRHCVVPEVFIAPIFYLELLCCIINKLSLRRQVFPSLIILPLRVCTSEDVSDVTADPLPR